MTHDVDELLHQAGARWRAEQSPPAEPSLVGAPAPRWRRHATVLAAAAAVAVVVTAALIGSRAFSHKRAVTPAPADSATVVPTHEPSPSVDPAALVIHDGNTAEAIGQVVAAPGKPVLFCPDLPVALPVPAPPPRCPADLAVVATGVDLTRLTDRHVTDGTTAGRAVLRGVYSGSTLRVTRQAPVPPEKPTDPDAQLPAILRRPPCPAPSGGWHRSANTDAIGGYIQARPGTFNGIGVTYADPPHNSVTVAVVGVARGNPAAVQAELRARFGPNICAVHVDQTAAEQQAVQDQVNRMMSHDGVYETWGAGNFGPVGVNISIMTPQRFAKLRQIGLTNLELHVWLEPVR